MKKMCLMIIVALFAAFPSIQTKVSAASDVRLTKNLYIILDASGSMYQIRCSGNKHKITIAKDSLSTFMQHVPADYNVGLYVFDNQGSRELVSLGKINTPMLLQKVKAIQAGGKTPLCNAIEKASEKLLTQKKEQLGYGEYIMLIVTDGEADNQVALPKYVQEATDEGIVVEVIGFCLASQHSLKTMVHKYREANSPEELKTALEAVLGEAEEFTDLSSFEEGSR